MLVGAVPTDMLGQEANLVLGWMRHYWDAYKDHEYVDLDALDSLIKLRGGYDANQLALVCRITAQLRKEVDATVVAGIVDTLMDLDLSGKAAALVARHQSGEDINLAYELHRLTTSAKERQAQAASTQWIQEDVMAILEDEATDRGLKFPTLLLHENIKGVLGGASIAVGARPDKGKTSLLAKIATTFAPQVPKYFGEDRPILWCNNEGSGRRIIPRVYQAALRCTTTELYAKSNAGTLRDEYIKAAGSIDRIRIKDMHGATLAEIEQVIEAMRPAVVFFDMLANFKLPGGSKGGNKTDDVEALWQTVREMAVRLDFVAVSTVQVSADGDDELYPAYSALKDSKTGIQGATDIILIMGALNSAQAQEIRGLSTPKNKYALPGKKSHVQGEVVFDAARCDFIDGAMTA